MNDRTFVDTNVWVYVVDADEPEKQRRARLILEPTADKDFVVSAQVLGEFFVVATRKLARPVAVDEAAAMVDRMSRLPVVPIDTPLVATAIAASREWQLSYRDALVITAAETAGCRRLYSEDLAHGAEYGTVRIENPFLAGANPGGRQAASDRRREAAGQFHSGTGDLSVRHDEIAGEGDW